MSMAVRKTSALFAVFAFVLLSTLAGTVEAQGRPSLIGDARAAVQSGGRAAGVLRSRQVSPNFAILSQQHDALRAAPGAVQQLDIAFFDDLTVTVNIERVERTERGAVNYYGAVAGDPYSRAVITDARGTLAVTVFTGGRSLQLRMRDGAYFSREIDTPRLHEHPDDTRVPPLSKSATDAPVMQADSADTIDVMVLYSATTRAAEGGTAAMEAVIDNGIAVTNSAYANSGVTQRVRLVHTQEINYTLDTPTKQIGEVLTELTNGTGAFSGVATLRNTYGADLVSFWMEGDGGGGGGNGGCGVAWLQQTVSNAFAPNGYSVLINFLCAVDNQSFPHEMGHNMGLRHDTFMDSASTPYAYAHGYTDPPHGFRTIMAYNNACVAAGTSCTRVNYFSSPLNTYSGFTTGNASTADAAHALNNTALTVANFRASVVGPGTLRMSAPTQSVSESVGTAQVSVTRTGGSAGAVSVDYVTSDGSATAGTDYTFATGTLNWADGDSAAKQIPVPVAGNSVVDASRTFTVTLSNVLGGATLGAPDNTVVTITNDDVALAFAQPTATFIEGNAVAVNIPVSRIGSSAGAVSVTWTTSDGSALAGTDFGTLGSGTQRTGTLNWANGDLAPKNITLGLAGSNIPVLNDAVIDGDKTFTITLSSPGGGASLGAQTTNTVTIVDTDSSLAFASTTASVSETAGTVTLTVQRTGSTVNAQTVHWATSNGSALAGSDFGTLGSAVQPSGTLTFPAGSGASQPIVIAIINDATIEGPETFNVTLSSPTGGAAIAGGGGVATVTINSDENGVAFAAGTFSFPESAGAQNVQVQRSGSTGAVHVNYAFTNGTAVNGTHFSGVSGSLDWADGETGAKSVPFTLIDDAVVNTARTFTVVLSGATGATIVAPASKLVTVTDDDNTVQFTVPTISATEGGALTLTVSRTGATGGAADVSYTTVDGTALAGTDFGILGNTAAVTGTLHWNAGDGANKTIPIAILNDAIIENVKTFTVQLQTPSGTQVGTNSTITVTLNDDEKSARFVSTTLDVTEGVNPSAILTVRRIGPATTAASAAWTTVNGTAIAGTDFGVLGSVAPRAGTLSWAIGDVANKTITIPIINDVVGGEPDKSFTVNLTPGSGFAAGAAPAATVTIHDDDIAPQSNVQFSAAKYMVIEGTPNVQLTLQRVDAGGGFGLPVSVKYSTVAGTAVAASDYTAATGVLVSWGAGDNADKNFTIPIVNNTTPEPPEFFKVTLSAPTPGLGFGTPNQATVWILDDDEAFPLDGIMPPGFSTPGGVTKGWHVSNDPAAAEGAFSLKSDEIDDGESAGLQMAGTFAAGNVTFKVKVSSEANADELRFYIDGVLQAHWSGVALTGWQVSATYPIGAGVHTLRWDYVKDGSITVGQDAAWLDALVTPAFAP